MRTALFTLMLTLAAMAGSAAGAQQAVSEQLLFTPPGCGGSSPFSDVSNLDAYCPWVKQFAADGISSGCGGGKFCPDQPVTRKQMALLMERAMRGTASWEPWRGAFRRTLIVNPVPGNSDASGSRLLAVLAEITDASLGNPYLVQIEPGRYYLANQPLEMQPFVDIEGSGIGTTMIYGSREGALVLGADDAELRSLTISNASANHPVGIGLAGDSMRLTDVRVLTSGELSSVGVQDAGNGAVLTRVSTLNIAWQPGSNAYAATVGGSAVLRECQFKAQAQSGTARGLVAFAGSPLLQRVRIEVDGGTEYGLLIETGANATLSRVDVVPQYGPATGIYLFDGSATIADSTVDTEGAGTVGIACSAGSQQTVMIRNSKIAGAVNGDPQCTLRIAHSQVGGNIVANGSPLTCYGLYDFSYNAKTCS